MPTDEYKPRTTATPPKPAPERPSNQSLMEAADWGEGFTRSGGMMGGYAMGDKPPAQAAQPARAVRVQGDGNYEYEVRGNDIYITKSPRGPISQPILVSTSTPRGVAAYNAIAAELEGHGIKLARIGQPELPDAKRQQFTQNVEAKRGAIASLYADMDRPERP